jgi:uncharacterized protein YjdB
VVVVACTEMMSSEVAEYDENAVADMILLPAEVVIGVGRTFQFQVSFRNAEGEEVDGQIDSWESSDIQVAVVDGDGTVTAVAPGETEITATANKGKGHGRDNAPGQLKKKSKVTVSSDTVATVEVVPSSGSLNTGQTMQFEAVVKDADGNVLQDRLVAWSTSDDQVATVDGEGAVTGAGAGSATIAATCEEKQGTAAVDVQEVVREIVQIAIWPPDVTVDTGQQVQFYVAALWSDGAKECDSSGASTDTGVLYNLTDYPAACDSAIARLSP